MKSRTLILFACVVAVAAGTVWYNTARSSVLSAPTPELIKLYGGPQGFAVLQHPDRVEAFRLEDKRGKPGAVTAGPVTVSPEQISRLSYVLQAPESYWWNTHSACIPHWGVRFTFYQGTDKLDVLLCFQCSQLGVSFNGSKLEDKDFDLIQPQILQIVKPLFPNDKVIQELRDFL